jgi:hypothetical protein
MVNFRLGDIEARSQDALSHLETRVFRNPADLASLVLMGDPAGKADRGPLMLDFDRRLMLGFQALRSPRMADCWLIASWMTCSP